VYALPIPVITFFAVLSSVISLSGLPAAPLPNEASVPAFTFRLTPAGRLPEMAAVMFLFWLDFTIEV